MRLLSPALVLLAPLLHSQSTARVSVGPGGTQANGPSTAPVISADGSVVAFVSLATNLGPTDTNGLSDIYVYDSSSATVTLASRSVGGDSANGLSLKPSLSAFGRYVTFACRGTDLVAGGTTAVMNVYVHDRTMLTTLLCSPGLGGNGAVADCQESAVSADGRFVVFSSSASNLVGGDGNGSVRDVFVFDTLTQQTELVSLDSAGVQYASNSGGVTSLSSDGRYVCFWSAAQLAPGALHGGGIYVRDRLAGTTTLVSLSDSGVPIAPLTLSDRPALSSDGRIVAFLSSAGSVVAESYPLVRQVFLRDLVQGRTWLVSKSSTGIPAGGNCSGLSLSGDGRMVAFGSVATNLNPADTLTDADVFLRDSLFSTTTLQSRASNDTAVNGDAQLGSSGNSSSADGQALVFSSAAAGFVPNDTNGEEDVFVHGRGNSVVGILCTGDGEAGPCPCSNSGGFDRGCNNSNNTGGAYLSMVGTWKLSLDTLVLTAQGEPPDVFNLFLQADELASPSLMADGISCLGGNVLRLYLHTAENGSCVAPQAGDASVSTRAAQLGHEIPMGATRVYQVLYRDPEAAFCPAPAGGSWNLSPALVLVWGP